MFENKKFKAIFSAEALMPLAVVILGGIAAAFYTSAGKHFTDGLDEKYRTAEKLCRIFYNCAMGYWIGLSAALLIVGAASFIIVLVQLFRAEKEKYCVARPLTIFLWSGVSVLETLKKLSQKGENKGGTIPWPQKSARRCPRSLKDCSKAGILKR